METEEQPKFCREFLFNIRSIVDMTESQIHTINREIKHTQSLLDSTKRTLEEAQRSTSQVILSFFSLNFKFHILLCGTK